MRFLLNRSIPCAVALAALFLAAAASAQAPTNPVSNTPAPGLLTPAPMANIQSLQPGPAQTAPLSSPPGPGLAGEPAPDGAPAAAPVKPKPKKVVRAAPPRETALSTDPTPTFTADTVISTATAAERYSEIADAGGWPVIPAALRPGSKGAGVTLLRRRLALEGDLDPSQEGDAPYNQVWDADLTAAVKHFQERMGLKQTGIVAGATLKAMNVPAATRFRQLTSSAQRIAASSFPFGDRYVVVNIPSASVEAVEHGAVAHRYVAVVGDVDHRSPEVATRIQAVNLNPTWTVPTSIIKNEIIPHMRRDASYLARAKIRILDNRGVEIDPRSINWSTEKAANYTLRQDSGAGNSLGAIRINMPNKDAVYMHDTPSKRLFGADYRFLSHGCVRVEGVYDFAAWLLEGTPASDGGKWDKVALLDGVASKDRLDIRLARSIPVIWVYLTGWADANGVVHFRDDVYGYDKVGDEDLQANAL